MTDHPLKSVTDRRLGKPLPYQLANQPRALLQAELTFHLKSLYKKIVKAYKVLALVSDCYPFPKGRFSRVTHPSATFPFIKINLKKLIVRLACVKHTASVHPEPGSNSQLYPVFSLN